MTPDTIDAAYVEHGSALATRTQPAAAPLALPSLFNTDDPEKFVEWTTKVANALVRVIEAKGLAKSLNRQKPDDKFVELEGWQLLGGMTKVYAVVEWTKEREDGWEARAQAFTLDGALVGAGEAVCLNTERNWKGRDSYAIKGMAQTRAMSRALRAPLGFIMTLAGYRATSAEEMPHDEPAAGTPPQRAQRPVESPRSDESPAEREKAKSVVQRGLAALGLSTDAEYAARISKATNGRVTSAAWGDLPLVDLNRLGNVLIEEYKTRKATATGEPCDLCGSKPGEAHLFDDYGIPCPSDDSEAAFAARAQAASRERYPELQQEIPL